MSAMDNFIDEWYDKALAAGQGFKTEAERQAYIESLGDPEDHPMFATDPDKLSSHPMTEAFRQLNEEDKTQYELVIMYKEEANDLMKKGNKQGWRDAVVRYTHSLTFIEPAIATLKEQEENAIQVVGQVEELEELKSPSVMQFEEQQRQFQAKQEAENLRIAALEQELAFARTDPAHTRGTKPVKAAALNPNLSFAGDALPVDMRYVRAGGTCDACVLHLILCCVRC
jgi:hypothetical protein